MTSTAALRVNNPSKAATDSSPVPQITPSMREEPSNSRLPNTTACLPFVYGSVAFYLAKKADDCSTHKWSLYLRGPNDEDISLCVAKVIFELHPSFSQPIRELVSPPFEVTEQGWGEFEAQIRIVWKDPDEKPIVVSTVIIAALLHHVSLQTQQLKTHRRRFKTEVDSWYKTVSSWNHQYATLKRTSCC